MLKPCHNRILIKITQVDVAVLRPESLTILENDQIEVLAVADGVTCCKPGDRILLLPDARNLIGIEKHDDARPPWATVIVHESVVMAVVVQDGPELG